MYVNYIWSMWEWVCMYAFAWSHCWYHGKIIAINHPAWKLSSILQMAAKMMNWINVILLSFNSHILMWLHVPGTQTVGQWQLLFIPPTGHPSWRPCLAWMGPGLGIHPLPTPHQRNQKRRNKVMYGEEITPMLFATII